MDSRNESFLRYWGLCKLAGASKSDFKKIYNEILSRNLLTMPGEESVGFH